MKKKSMMKKDAAPAKMAEAAPMKTMKGADKCQSCMCGSCSCEHWSWGLTVLRLVVGIGFLLHGLQKLTGLGGVENFFAMLGLPSWLGVVIALVETLGGLALIFGIWTRWAGYALALTMAGALVFAKFGWGMWGWVAIIAMLVGLIALDCASSKKWACWLVTLVFAVLLITAVVKMVSPINPKFELDLAYLAASLAIAWGGAGRMSLHSNCKCCTK